MGSATTFAGAVRKNKLIKYLEQVADHQFLTLVNGSTINEMEFERAVTQVSQAEPVLTAGAEFQGRNDRYHLLSSLGEGAVGKVWRARSSETGQLVAVKVMLPRQDLLDPRRLPDVERRFEREGRNGLKLSHRALVPHLDIGSWNGRRFIVLALARESVKDKLIAGSGKMPLKETIPIIQAAVDALSYLHSKKCIHRDVKPSNMLLLGSAYVLSDLGVVRWSDLNPEFTEAGTITNESIQLGSLRYMAPEQQVSSHEAVAQSDVYALGMTWYELLTGSTIPAALFFVVILRPP